MTTLREAATQALEALEDFGMLYYENTGIVPSRSRTLCSITNGCWRERFDTLRRVR